VELPGGEVIEPPVPSAMSMPRIRFSDWRAVWNVIWDPLFQFPEMYVSGRVEIDAPLEHVTVEVFRAIQLVDARSGSWLRLARLKYRPRGTSLRRARQNIHHHYDIGNDFYALWLDGHMAYTCAYFPEPDVSLEDAQIAKFDHVCRKVRLQPGMHVIEAGCGWGGLALHMARHYGVTVQAYNISHQQICFARVQAEREGLADRVEFVEADWRTIRGSCDVFMSVGMLEHVGRRNYRQLGQLIDRVLKPGGRGLIHSIGQNVAQPASPWIERRIFPGGYPPSLSEMMRIFEPNGFSVLDIENIRLHYAQTLRHWLDRFRNHEPRVREMFDERFVRMWGFYLAGSYAAFVTGSYQLFQVVFNRAADNDVSWTRASLYQKKNAQRPVAHPFVPPDSPSNR
jgi:cyclopropane-fatty-acyl-phospholipid synthase